MFLTQVPNPIFQGRLKSTFFHCYQHTVPNSASTRLPLQVHAMVQYTIVHQSYSSARVLCSYVFHAVKLSMLGGRHLHDLSFLRTALLLANFNRIDFAEDLVHSLK